LPAATPELRELVVVLVRTRNPLNIGAAARAMRNFGAESLRLVNPYPVAFRDARSAVGASDVLHQAQEYKSLADAVADCRLVVGTTAVRNRVLHNPLRRLNQESASAIRTAMQSGRVALLFGSEKIGLTNEDFTHCHWLLNIPTYEQQISMNLGQAVAVCLFGISSGVSGEEPPAEGQPANAGELEKITQGLYEALKMSGYVKPGNDTASQEKVRRLVLRFNMPAMDAKVLLGMVRQIVWKLRQPR
jgi:TrmH family RNA methyltransferase